jgi:hypothetical protein
MIHDVCELPLPETMSENPVVFFDITIGGSPKGRIEMELRPDIVPITAENFRCVSNRIICAVNKREISILSVE